MCSLKPAIIVETVDLGIEFLDESRPELAERGSLDEALKARAPSLLGSAPGELLHESVRGSEQRLFRAPFPTVNYIS